MNDHIEPNDYQRAVRKLLRSRGISVFSPIPHEVRRDNIPAALRALAEKRENKP